MPKIATIDPGTKDCGLAIWDAEEKRLLACKFVRAPRHPRNQWMLTAQTLAAHLSHFALDILVIERMEPRREKPSAWSDLVDISLMSGCLMQAAGLNDVQMLRPSKWTGGRKKVPNQIRIRARLDRDELAILDDAIQGLPMDDASEVLDAVGMGLYVLQRL